MHHKQTCLILWLYTQREHIIEYTTIMQINAFIVLTRPRGSINATHIFFITSCLHFFLCNNCVTQSHRGKLSWWKRYISVHLLRILQTLWAYFLLNKISMYKLYLVCIKTWMKWAIIMARLDWPRLYILVARRHIFKRNVYVCVCAKFWLLYELSASIDIARRRTWHDYFLCIDIPRTHFSIMYLYNHMVDVLIKKAEIVHFVPATFNWT